MRTNPEPTRKIYEAFKEGRTMHHGPRGGRLPGSLHVTANTGNGARWSTLHFHDSAIVHWDRNAGGPGEIGEPVVFLNLAGWGHSPCTREAINRALAIMGIPHWVELKKGFVTFADGILPHSGMVRVWPFPTGCDATVTEGPSNARILRRENPIRENPNGRCRWKIRAKTAAPNYPGRFIVSAFQWNIWARQTEVYRWTVDESGAWDQTGFEENDFLPALGRFA